VGLIWAAPASADVATSISSELTANGVPSPSVSVSTPAAATTADMTAYDADPSQEYASVTPYNLLSLDPTAPGPVATVSFVPTAPHPYPGTLPAPGEPGDFVEDSQVPVWDLYIALAVKHAVAGGASIAGLVTFGAPFASPQGARDTTQPESWESTPDPTEFTAANPPQGATLADVQLDYQLGLPPAYSTATVSVADAAGGQRIVTIQLDRTAASFATDNLAALTDYADTMQAQLNADPLQGANIGGVIVRSNETGTTTPLYVHAADTTWGQQFDWSAPTVRTYTEPDDSSS
jgi:hypothetical protein